MQTQKSGCAREGKHGRYLDDLGLDTVWLVIFDRRPGLPTMGEQGKTKEAVSPAGRAITVIRRSAFIRFRHSV